MFLATKQIFVTEYSNWTIKALPYKLANRHITVLNPILLTDLWLTNYKIFLSMASDQYQGIRSYHAITKALLPFHYVQSLNTLILLLCV